jgi:hypothetical protein
MYTLQDWYKLPFYSFYFEWEDKTHLIHWDAMYAANALTESQDAHGFNIVEDESGDLSLILELNMNDTFYYASADSEALGPRQCLELSILKLIYSGSPYAAVHYAESLRGAPALEPIRNRQEYKDIKNFELALKYTRWLLDQEPLNKLSKKDAYNLADFTIAEVMENGF